MSDATLLPLNASPAERSLAAAIAAVAREPDANAIRDVWSADRCPLPLLPWLAWAYSLDSWKSYWPESVKRARVRDAVPLARKKGTKKAVQDAVAAFGASLVMREWWETTPRGVPHTFDLVLTVGGLSPSENSIQYQDDIVNEIYRVKPARSHFTLTAGIEASAVLVAQAGAQPYQYTRIQFTEA